MQLGDQFEVIEQRGHVEWRNDMFSRPSMIMRFNGTSIYLSALVRPPYVDKLRADDWCKRTLAEFDGKGGGAKDGVKGQGRVDTTDPDVVERVMQAATAVGRAHFNE